MSKKKKSHALVKKAPTRKLAVSKKSNKQIWTPPNNNKKLVLHVGCGDQKTGAGLHERFKNKDKWHEIRLDISPTVRPEICADMCDLHMIKDNSVDAIWSSHNLEHLFHHNVFDALGEFRRVLKIDGLLAMATPDIQMAMEFALKNGIEKPIYDSPSGPISPIDILYGLKKALKNGHHYMAHKTAFTAGSLANKLIKCGYCDIVVQRQGVNLNAIAYKRAKNPQGKPNVKILEQDINKMMRIRDEVDVEPVQWKGYKKP